jgi:hypothetical protein
MTLKHTFAVASLVTGFSLGASAATITLTANNGFGASGLNSATGWSVAAAPAAGNDYITNGFLLRTPADGASYTFAGDSLTVTDGNGISGFAGAANDALMWKGSGTAAVITVNNLIINGGQIRHGQGDGDSFTLAGNISVGTKGAGFATQGATFVTAPISGTSSITVMDNGSGGAVRTVYFQSPSSTFTGNILLNSARSRLTFNNGGVANFVLGATGVNNSISVNTGSVLTLDGLFNINTVSADLTPGNSWNLITGTATYGSNFAISGFSAADANTWTNPSNTLSFSTVTGTLTSLAAVPEPSAFAALAGLAGLGFAASRRRRA